MNKPALVIIAAGMSSRYGVGLKQIDPVGPNGEFIIDYSVYDAARAGFSRVVFVIKREMEKVFHETIGRRVGTKIAVDYAFQEMTDIPAGYEIPAGREKLWGTAHAVMAARHAVKEPFAAINADDFYGRGSYVALCDYLKSVDPAGYDFAMVGYKIENTLSASGLVSRGVCTVRDGYLSDVTERTKIGRHSDGSIYYAADGAETAIPRGSVVSLNAWAFTPRMFDALEAGFPAVIDGMGDKLKGEYFLPSAVSALVEEGKATVRVLDTDERWYGVTYAEDKAEVAAAVRNMIKNGVYPENLWE